MSYDNWKLQTPTKGRSLGLNSGNNCHNCGAMIPVTHVFSAKKEKVLKTHDGRFYKVTVYECTNCQ